MKVCFKWFLFAFLSIGLTVSAGSFHAPRVYEIKDGVWTEYDGSSMIRHSNGQLAWWGTGGDTIYHSNGRIAWWGSRGDAFYYPKGQRAWWGHKGDSIYHSNGKQAWWGSWGGGVYHSSGKKVDKDFLSGEVSVTLDKKGFLSVDDKGDFHLSIYLGPDLFLDYDSYLDMYFIRIKKDYRTSIAIEMS